MIITRDMIAKFGACTPGIVLFDRDFPTGEWDVTPNSCIAGALIYPWDWLAENILSGAGKIRYLRVLSVQRNWFLIEREKLIARLDGGIADEPMKMLMASIEEKFKEARAAAFCAAASAEESDAV